MKGKDSNDKNIVADWEAFLLAKIEPESDNDDNDEDDSNIVDNWEAFLFDLVKHLM